MLLKTQADIGINILVPGGYIRGFPKFRGTFFFLGGGGGSHVKDDRIIGVPLFRETTI